MQYEKDIISSWSCPLPLPPSRAWKSAFRLTDVSRCPHPVSSTENTFWACDTTASHLEGPSGQRCTIATYANQRGYKINTSGARTIQAIVQGPAEISFWRLNMNNGPCRLSYSRKFQRKEWKENRLVERQFEKMKKLTHSFQVGIFTFMLQNNERKI